MVIIREIFCLTLILFITIPLKAVTVNPNLCPTNKIAPHRRVESWQNNRARTFGAFYDLLGPNNPGPLNDAPNDLQETPQEDDPDDCGEIDDYDEYDLSSITPQGQRRQGHRKKRILFGDFPYEIFGSNDSPVNPNRPQRPPYTTNRPTYSPDRPSYSPNRPNYSPNRPNYDPNRPTYDPNRPNYDPNRPNYDPNRPTYDPNRPNYDPNRPNYDSNRPNYDPNRPNYDSNRPSYTTNRPNYSTNRPSHTTKRPSTRSPYWSGGLFGTNGYQPQHHEYPSDYVKPVFESDSESHVTYRPNVVGGPLSHVVGVSPVRPTYANSDPTSIRTPNYYSTRYQTTTQYPVYQTRQPRPRSLNNNSGILKSFVDLLFK